jgi:hypothetical protein
MSTSRTQFVRPKVLSIMFSGNVLVLWHVPEEATEHSNAIIPLLDELDLTSAGHSQPVTLGDGESYRQKYTTGVATDIVI